jgi:hypothetical protein
MSLMFLIMALLSLFWPSRAAAAANIYFAQSAQGANNGSDCADAYAYNDGTHGINQSQPGSFVAGNTLHLCGGTWSGAAGQQWISSGLSGTSSSPITIVFEAGAILSAPYHTSQGAIQISGSYYTIDGGTNGVIQNTANGTPGYSGCISGSCTQQQNTRAVYLTGTNIEVKNLTISDFYMFKPGSGDSFPTNDGQEGIYFSGGHNNITIDHNVIHDMNHGLDGWGNNINIFNNEIYNCGRCTVTGSGTVISGFVFHDNSTHDLNLAGSGVHCDGIHLFPNSGGQQMQNVQLYNNLFYNPCNGDNTSFMYFEGSFGGAPPVEVFNNLCVLAAGQADFCVEAGYDGGLSSTISGAIVVNNSCVGGQYGPTSYSCFTINTGWTALTFENNVQVLGGQTTSPLQGGLVSFGSGTFKAINNNMYQNLVADSGDSNTFGVNGDGTASFTAWQGMLTSGSGQDSASVFNTLANLKVSLTTGQLQAGSPGIGAGANLTGLGISALNCDKPSVVGASGTGACNPRPTSGAWDIGAYSQTSTATAPASPTDLTATVQPGGN